MTEQTRSFPFDRSLLLNALYDVIDQIGAKLISGDSSKGKLHIKMPDGYGEIKAELKCDKGICNVRFTSGSDKTPKLGYEQEALAIQTLFSRLELFLAGLK